MILSSPTGVRRTRSRPKSHRPRPGVAYYGYRYYDPVTGRWPSRDPIEEMGGANLYGFVGNDGMNRWDLLGMVLTMSVSGTTGGATFDIDTTAEKCEAKLDNTNMTIYGFGNSEYDAGVTVRLGRVYTLVGVSSEKVACDTYIPIGGPPGGSPNGEAKCPGEKCKIKVTVRYQDYYLLWTSQGSLSEETFYTQCKKK